MKGGARGTTELREESLLHMIPGEPGLLERWWCGGERLPSVNTLKELTLRKREKKSWQVSMGYGGVFRVLFRLLVISVPPANC